LLFSGTWTEEVSGGGILSIAAADMFANGSTSVYYDDMSLAEQGGAGGTGIATATDGCGATTITFSDSSVPGCGNTETITRTWTATDECGNTSTCVQIITVVDSTPPVITCPADVTVECGDDTSPASTGTATGTDVCGTVAITFADSSVAGCGNTETITRTWTATDECGNTSTCVQTITVVDSTPPVITCPADATVECGDDTSPASTGTATGTDICGTVVITFADSSVAGCGLTETITRTWTATDECGNTSTCVQTITVVDTTPPIITCPADITVSNDPGICGAIIDYVVSGSDTCGGVTINQTDGLPSGSTFPVGTTTNTFVITDDCGNTATCSFDITVNDTEPPIIVCPPDLSVDTDPGDCTAVVIFPDAIAFDNCDVDTVIQTDGLPSGSAFPLGVNVVEFTATDIHGNSSVCSFTIIVTDNEDPVVVCQDITIQLDEFGDASIVPGDVVASSSDNCGVDTITIDIDTFDCSDVGPNNVTVTVTDVNGNVSTCIAVVTVEDVTPPVAVCMDITVELDENGTVTITGLDINGGSTDACGIASYDLDIDTFDCDDVGENTVVLTVTDVNGNTSTCTATVTVEDNTAPELVCMDITLELDENGQASIIPDDVIDTLSDACGIETTAVDIFEFNCDDIGTPITVTVFAMDVNGNLSTCMAEVTVVDLMAPELVCPEDQTHDPGPGNLYWEVPDYFANGEASATDNCTDPVTITGQDPAPGTLLPDGVYTVTIWAEDEYNNYAECTFELTIESLLGNGDDKPSLGSLILYPNPATDVVILSNPQEMLLDKVDFYDLTGRLVQSVSLTGMGAERSIDISHLASAPYLVIIQGENGSINKQLIKE
jgi:hypothetical protein